MEDVSSWHFRECALKSCERAYRPTAIVDAQVSNMPLADGRSEGARGTDPGALYRYTALIFDVTLSVE